MYLSWFKVRLCDQVSNAGMVLKLALNPYNSNISFMKSLLIKKGSYELSIKDSAQPAPFKFRHLFLPLYLDAV